MPLLCELDNVMVGLQHGVLHRQHTIASRRAVLRLFHHRRPGAANPGGLRRVSAWLAARPEGGVKRDIRRRIRYGDRRPPIIRRPTVHIIVIRDKAGQRRGADQLLKGKFLRLHQEFGRGHFLPAEHVPESKLRAQQKVEAVDLRKAHRVTSCQRVRRRDADIQVLLLNASASPRGGERAGSPRRIRPFPRRPAPPHSGRCRRKL